MHERVISETLLSPRRSLANGSICSSLAVSKQASKGSHVNDWFGNTARQEVHARSRRSCLPLTAASNPPHTMRDSNFAFQTLPRDVQINDRVLRAKARIDIPEPRPLAGNPFPRGLPAHLC